MIRYVFRGLWKKSITVLLSLFLLTAAIFLSLLASALVSVSSANTPKAQLTVAKATALTEHFSAAEGIIILEHYLLHSRVDNCTEGVEKIGNEILIEGAICTGAVLALVGDYMSISVGRIAIRGRRTSVAYCGRKPSAHTEALGFKIGLVFREFTGGFGKKLFIAKHASENQHHRVRPAFVKKAGYLFSARSVMAAKLYWNTKSVHFDLLTFVTPIIYRLDVFVNR